MKFWKWLSLGLLLALIGVQVQLWTGQGSISESNSLKKQLDELTRMNAELRERNEKLVVEVEELRDGRDSVEEMAREELGMIREGESYYVVVNKNKE